MKYFLHRSLGFTKDYFGEVGPLYQTNFLVYYIMKIAGYRVTKEREESNMNVLISILGILAILYLGAGALMGWYEMSQTDDPFKVSNIFLWLPRMLNLIKF